MSSCSFCTSHFLVSPWSSSRPFLTAARPTECHCSRGEATFLRRANIISEDSLLWFGGKNPKQVLRQALSHAHRSLRQRGQLSTFPQETEVASSNQLFMPLQLAKAGLFSIVSLLVLQPLAQRPVHCKQGFYAHHLFHFFSLSWLITPINTASLALRPQAVVMSLSSNRWLITVFVRYGLRPKSTNYTGERAQLHQ